MGREGSYLRGEDGLPGRGPPCAKAWRGETAPSFQLVCVQVLHVRVGSRVKQNVGSFPFLSVVGNTPAGLLLAPPGARSGPLPSGESAGEKEELGCPI